jgi:hypothetical protein
MAFSYASDSFILIQRKKKKKKKTKRILHVILFFSPESLLRPSGNHPINYTLPRYLPDTNTPTPTPVTIIIHPYLSPRPKEPKTNSSINQPNTTSPQHPSHPTPLRPCLSTQPSHALAMCCCASRCQIRIGNLDTTCHREIPRGLPI